MKCPATITGMVNALAKKYPDKYVNIRHCYSKHSHMKSIIIQYELYIEDVPDSEMPNRLNLSYQELKDLVAEHLK